MRLTAGPHSFDCADRPVVMGILNVGTDSPVAHSVVETERARERAAELRDTGAAIIDVGAHSTRSGGEAPSPTEEIARLVPAIEALCADGHCVSVDTWTAAVAEAAARAGAHILNDVTGAADPAMAEVAVRHGMPLIVMHMRGQPKRHRSADQHYDDIGAEVRAYLAERVDALTAAGVPDVWVDPGFEFAKSPADNVRMLLDLPQLATLGRPIVISASRKNFLAALLGHGDLRSAESQGAPGILEATVAFNVLAAYLGAHVVRVHDVAAVEHALRVVAAVRREARSVQSSRAGRDALTDAHPDDRRPAEPHRDDLA